MTEEIKAVGTPEAPHGYGADGKPLAPYGYKADGTPRKDGRGRPAGGRVAAPKKKAAPAKKSSGPAARTQAETREMLVAVADIVLMPVAGFGASPLARRWLGERHAAALPGDVVIAQSCMPDLADAVMVMAQTRPGMLNFLDRVEENAGALLVARALLNMTKAIVGNHVQPDPRLAEAGRTLLAVRAAQMAEAIEAQAQAMGIDPDQIPQAA